MPRTKRRGEVSLTEFLIVLVILIGGLLMAGYASDRFGWLGFVGGGLIGAIASFVVFMLFAYMWAFVEAVCFAGIPYLPRCGSGKCKSGLLTDFGDYESEHNDDHRAYFRCKCGRLYWRNRQEGRVLEVLSDGTTKPYMVWRSFRGWHPDDKLETDDA